MSVTGEENSGGGSCGVFVSSMDQGWLAVSVVETLKPAPIRRLRGLMGVLADVVLKTGGRVTGVMPEGLMTRELGHLQLTKLHIVADMHERKALMPSLADGFIARRVGHI